MSIQVEAPGQEVVVQLPDDEMQIRFRPDETIVFASSSGHCNLDCGYCVAAPVVKQQPSLTFEDLLFLRNEIGGPVFFIFSGKGDFFAGFPKNERLLNRLLDLDGVGVALDINGVTIQGFSELTAPQLAKIRSVNLTFHYRQLVEHNALKVWRQNALTMLRLHDGADFFVNFILSPSESALWEEALEWYEENVFSASGKRLILINDVNLPFRPSDEEALNRASERFAHLLQSVRRGNFEAVLKSFDHVACAAGQSYFRVWNDGAIEACPNVDELRDFGNAKLRTFKRREQPFICSSVRYCDCYHIASANRMTFYRGPATQRPDGVPRRVISISRSN